VVERSDTTGIASKKAFASWRDARFFFDKCSAHDCISQHGMADRRLSAILPGSMFWSGRFTGGVAALNHRLITAIPLG